MQSGGECSRGVILKIHIVSCNIVNNGDAISRVKARLKVKVRIGFLRNGKTNFEFLLIHLLCAYSIKTLV